MLFHFGIFLIAGQRSAFFSPLTTVSGIKALRLGSLTIVGGHTSAVFDALSVDNSRSWMFLMPLSIEIYAFLRLLSVGKGLKNAFQTPAPIVNESREAFPDTSPPEY